MSARRGFYHPSRTTISLRGLWLRLRDDFTMATLRRQPNHMTRAGKDAAECPQCRSIESLKNLEFLVRYHCNGGAHYDQAYTAKSCEKCLDIFEQDINERTQFKIDAYDEGWEVACDYCNSVECAPPQIVHSEIDNLRLIACEPCKEART